MRLSRECKKRIVMILLGTGAGGWYARISNSGILNLMLRTVPVSESADIPVHILYYGVLGACVGGITYFAARNFSSFFCPHMPSDLEAEIESEAELLEDQAPPPIELNQV